MNPNSTPADRPVVSASELAAHLRVSAGRYFDDASEAEAQVRLLRAEDRSYSRLFWFEVQSGRCRRRVLIKARTELPGVREMHQGAGPQSDRPRLHRPAPPELKYVLEHRALSLIHDHISRLHDQRFGSVRALELLPRHRALVMEAVEQPSLRHLAIRCGRICSPAANSALHHAFRHAGAWLRSYHRLSPSYDVPVGDSGRGQFVRFVDQLSRYLGVAHGQDSFFSRVSAAVADQASEFLTEVAEVGLEHGDFAMRNVLVGPGQRVTTLDTLANVRGCVYRDLAHFLVDLQCSVPTALSQAALLHPVLLPGYREALLAGYFERDSRPEHAIRLYEVQVLLERWCSAVWHRSVEQDYARIAIKRTRLAMMSAYFRRAIRTRLSPVEISRPRHAIAVPVD